MYQKMSLIVILMLLLTGIAYAEEATETATICYETVHVNGAPLNTMDLDYPLLNYKGVTYLPLTWQACRHLGMVQEWNDETQTLSLKSTVEVEPVARLFEGHYYSSQQVNIKVSDVNFDWQGLELKLDNYPLIEYEHVQYIPLTWEFVAGKLGWGYHWNKTEGLVVNRYGDQAIARDVQRFDAFATFMQTKNKGLSDEEAARYTRIVMDAADKYGIDDTWVMAVFWQESYYDANCTYGSALGAMQIMESTGRTYGLNREQLFIPEINIDFGVRYLSGLKSYYNGDLHKGTLAYNQGTLRVNRGTSRTWYLDDIIEKEAAVQSYLANYISQ